jgi:hypothetical protein
MTPQVSEHDKILSFVHRDAKLIGVAEAKLHTPNKRLQII